MLTLETSSPPSPPETISSTESSTSTTASLADVIEEEVEEEVVTLPSSSSSTSTTTTPLKMSLMTTTAAAERASALSGGGVGVGYASLSNQTPGGSDAEVFNSSSSSSSSPSVSIVVADCNSNISSLAATSSATGAKNADSTLMTHQRMNDADDVTITAITDEEHASFAPFSAWLLPELAKVAETLQLLRTRLPNAAGPNSWQLDNAICHALDATRRVADQYLSASEEANYMMMTASPSDNSVIDVMMGDNNPNSEYQTLSRYCHQNQRRGSTGSDQPDYQKLAIMNGLTPPDDANYEANMVATLSDEDEYDRLAYEFPIHPSMRKRVANLPQPPNLNDSDDDQAPRHQQQHRPPRSLVVSKPKLVDASTGRVDGSVFVNEKACNTYRVLNITRSVQAVELPPAKFSKHIQTHVLVTDKCVGEDADDVLNRRLEVECQTDDVVIRSQEVTEDSWAQTEDKFTENVSVQSNMLRDFGQNVATQTLQQQQQPSTESLSMRRAVSPAPPQLCLQQQQPIEHLTMRRSPTPLAIDTITPQKLYTNSATSPRQLTPSNSFNHHNSNPYNFPMRHAATRQYSSASSSGGGGSLRSPSTPNNPSTSNGCYQLFVRIDQNSRGSTAQLQQVSGVVGGLGGVNGNANTSSSAVGKHLTNVSSNNLAATSHLQQQQQQQHARLLSSTSDAMIIPPPVSILSPVDSGTSNGGFHGGTGSMSPPISDSQGLASNSDDADRSSSPRSWQSPIQITGPTETLATSPASPQLTRPNLPLQRQRRASVNPQAPPFRSGQLAAITPSNLSAFKSLIKISEGSPPEIRHALAPTEPALVPTTKVQAQHGQLTQVHPAPSYQQNQVAHPQKQITKIIHRLQRDPSIRAWCSVDNLLRQTSNGSDSGETSGDSDPRTNPDRAISPPPLFREFGELRNESGGIHEMAIDCGIAPGIASSNHQYLRNAANRYPAQQVIIPPPKTKQLSMSDVTRDEAVIREPALLKPSKRNNSHHQLQQLQMQRDNVVCLGRRTLVSVGATSGEDSDYSVMEAVFDSKPHRGKASGVKTSATARRTNYAALAALNHSRSGEPGSGSNSSNSSSSGGGSSVLSRLSHFLNLGNSKQKRTLPIQC